MLQVELDYTDAIGVRRTVIKDIPFNSVSLSAIHYLHQEILQVEILQEQAAAIQAYSTVLGSG